MSDFNRGKIEEVREFLNSGIFRVYLLTSIISGLFFTLIIKDINKGLILGFWCGVFATIVVNEFTKGSRMTDLWICKWEL